MKKLRLSLLLAAGIIALHACNGGTNDQKDSVDSAKEVNNEVKPVDKETSDFVVKAAAAGATEIELGKLAAQKAVDPRVKSFGQMMVDDHTKAGEELKSLASAQQVAYPATLSEDAQKHAEEMGKKNGKDFDKAYMDMMVNDHKSVIDDFQKASANLKDSAFKDFATRTLPVLQKHLDSAQAITNKK